jgi:hypothetical protein
MSSTRSSEPNEFSILLQKTWRLPSLARESHLITLEQLGLILTGAIAWVAVGVLTKAPRTTLLSPPAELLIQIADDLPPESLAVCRMTCRRLHGLLLPRKDRQLTESWEVNLRYIQLLLRDSRNGREFRQVGCRACLRIISLRNLRPEEPDIEACPHAYFRAPLYWGESYRVN